MDSPRAAFTAGARAFLPLVLGIMPFALVSGVAAIAAGLSVPSALSMSFLVYAGSAQLVALQLLTANAPAVLIVFTALVVNLRFMIYSATLAPSMERNSWFFKALSAYVITDQSYALAMNLALRLPNAAHRAWFHLGAALTMWLLWQVAAMVGIFLGAQVPSDWQLEFTIPLTFIALVVPRIKDRVSGSVALTAAICAALTAALPFKTGLLISLLAAVTVGLALEKRS
jgi:4-azaleucine resistance transporter AzlC